MTTKARRYFEWGGWNSDRPEANGIRVDAFEFHSVDRRELRSGPGPGPILQPLCDCGALGIEVVVPDFLTDQSENIASSEESVGN